MSHASTTPATGMPVGRGLWFLVVAGIAWGTAGAAGSLVYRISDLGPLALSFWRSLGGLVLLLGVMALRPHREPAPVEPRRRRLTRILVTGVGLTVFQSVYFGAVELTGLAVGTVVGPSCCSRRW